MFSNLEHPIHRLRTQLIVSFLVSFLIIAMAVGIPAVITINRQATSQANLLLDQALLSTGVFLGREKSDLENLALLISQRPTLAQLLAQGDSSGLRDYMRTLQKSAGLDLLLICSNGNALPETDPGTPGAEYCNTETSTGYAGSPTRDDLFLYASAAVESPVKPAYKIVVGKSLSSILTRLQAETGLVYFLLQKDHVLNSSDPLFQMSSTTAQDLENNIRSVRRASPSWQLVRYQDHQYLLGSLNIDSLPGFSLVAALNLDDQLSIQRDLRWAMVVGLLLIVLIASALGIYLSQRISQPMARLAHAATEFRRGHLDKPVSLRSRIWEIRQLANTLEDARVALQHSLTQLQAKTAWNEQLLNSIVECIITLDYQNRITFASDGIANIMNVQAAEVVGRKVDDVFLPAQGELSFSGQLPEAGQTRRISVEMKAGIRKLLSISMAKFVPPEAEDANRALVIRDVSQDEYVHRLLGDFMANITHEFRTPLAALEASVELLLDNLSSLSKEEIQELLLSLNLGIIDLQTLIDNLIESASIEAGRFRVSVRPVSFETILKDAMHVIGPLANKYSLDLQSAGSPQPGLVMADHRRTVQVLVNLLSNAVKHSPADGCIRIEHQVRNDKLYVEVIDEGSGFTGDQRTNLFRRFSHLDTSDERARHGAGLGLSVVKAIVEAQQGEVGLRDTGQRGACIWFSIPLAPASEL